MKRSVEDVWAVLIILTIFAYLLGELKLVNTLLVGILLITTFIKGHLVIDYFMGLKNVRWRYRIILTLWLIIVISSIALAYLLPTNIK